MTAAALLTLTLLASPARGEPVSATELLPLPAVEGPVAVSAAPFERTVTVTAARGAPAIARALRALSRGICRQVAERPGAAILTCRSRRVAASLVRRDGGLALELRELAGLPASGDAAMPILFHDPLSMGLSGCPGASHAARGECRLREGRADLARGSFLTASRSPIASERDHALLRLGDLDLASSDVAGAQRSWALVEGAPWRRMAEARRCELSQECLAAKGAAPFARDDLPPSVSREMALRAARARAFAGELAQAAWGIADQFTSTGACAGDAPLCRRIVLAALRSPDDAVAREALSIYSAAVRPGTGRLAVELAVAAASVAERNGAPAYAAALLSGVSAAVPERDVADHLLRTAELYVAAGDAVRARVVVDFLRTQRGGRRPPGPRWAALLREVARLRSRAAPPAPPRHATVPELAAAARALDRARSTGTPLAKGATE